MYFRKVAILVIKYKQKKSLMIHQYNSWMGGVDVKDKIIYQYSFTGPCRKCLQKIAYNFMDMTLLNAWFLFKLQNQKFTRIKFMTSLVEQLVSDESPHLSPVATNTS